MITEMTREIEEIYSIKELEDRRRLLRQQLQQSTLSAVETCEIEDVIDTINKRIRLMNDLMIGLQPT
ncbi:hypothetical protein [Ammoniphilus sp. YIM 78166]|uniref:hypothetical protein n=1 Tax=Ammoniphilus sp. YIM 78166 TaxID=1644106 RepID=UPI00106FDDDC|nr:hypothetical protein [Ammoniphilus sp. YIM 78166]